ncbi:MAG TPA: hypothetical protein DCS97_00945, partial [Planctomycetes bacterium]|nr:hypothetical protein [Planctomycetota bacterium]
MSEIPLLADLLKRHLDSTGSSARALAERLDASYPSVLAWLSKGGVPRKAEHREGLRRELALAPDVFARIIAASSKEPIDIPHEGPLDLRQLLLKHLGERNLTERTFADIAGVPYATLMGITRRGAVPRQDALQRLAQALGLSLEAVREASSRTRGEAEAAGHEVEVTDDAGLTDQPPTATITAIATVDVMPEATGQELARIARERVAGSGLSVAAFARTHDLPYLALSKLLATGIEPEHAETLQQLRAAFPAVASPSPAATSASAAPAAASGGSRALRRSDATDQVADHPLHELLLRLVRERGWSQQRFAQESGLAAPTAAKL